MVVRPPVSVRGVKELRAALNEVERKLPRELRVAFNEAAKHVVGRAKPNVPVRSGALMSSIKPASTQRTGRVTYSPPGKVPYAGWIEFGGTIRGPKGARVRPFIKQGRYLFPAAEREREPVIKTLEEQLGKLIKRAGLG
jgi:hypothetical protein